MQPSRFIQQATANPQTEAAHFCSGPPSLVHPATFSQTSFSQIRETKDRAYEFNARRSLHAGSVPNEVRWKNLLRHLRVRRLPEVRL